MVAREFGLHRQPVMDTMGPGGGGRGRSGGPPGPHPSSSVVAEDDVARRFLVGEADQSQTDEATHRLGRASYLCDLRHDADQTLNGAATVVEPGCGVVSRWRMKDRVSISKDSFHMRGFMEIVALVGLALKEVYCCQLAT